MTKEQLDKAENEEVVENVQAEVLPEDEVAAEPAVEDAASDQDAQKLQAQYDEMRDKYLRLNADFENFRRHSAKEKMEILDSVKADFVKNMLPIIDDFERAMTNIGAATDVDALKEGVGLIYRKFGEFLTRSGISVLDPKGEEFNPEIHEAIARMPASDAADKGKVFDCVEKGYKLGEKMIRYPKVVVNE